ncbi:hypothetical protein EVA_02192 [gut metagenome]|uniref:Uncharacterized protein n=1 Tax=gut metagenome TaxID=749906 RepID=J9DA08_9ZZZZ
MPQSAWLRAASPPTTMMVPYPARVIIEASRSTDPAPSLCT